MNIIKEIRGVTGLSQGQFAKLFEVSRNTVIKWDQGTAKPPMYVPKMMLRILIAEENEYNEEELKVLQQRCCEQDD